MKDNFIGYEYITKTTKKLNQEKLIDIYEAFGWEVTTVDYDTVGRPRISFKRMRNLENKAELNRLQRNAESTMNAIEKLELKIKDKPQITSLIIGTIGTLIFGGGLSLVLLKTSILGAVVAGVILCLIGVIVAIVNVTIYRNMVDSLANKFTPEIETNEEKLINICENANHLLKQTLMNN